jgi:hypothetical protein
VWKRKREGGGEKGVCQTSEVYMWVVVLQSDDALPVNVVDSARYTRLQNSHSSINALIAKFSNQCNGRFAGRIALTCSV